MVDCEFLNGHRIVGWCVNQIANEASNCMCVIQRHPNSFHRPRTLTHSPIILQVKFRNPFGEYGALKWEPTFLGNELEFYLLAILTFIHAYRHGARYMWLWWTTVAHGLTTELVSYWVPHIDNFCELIARAVFLYFN